MTNLQAIFLLVMSSSLMKTSQFCASDGSATPPTPAAEDVCTADSFANLHTPPIRNNSTYYKKSCTIAVLLDLDRTFTSPEDYSNVLIFIGGMVSTCMERGVGYMSNFTNMFNASVPPTLCCDESVCSRQIGFMSYYDFVGKYDSLATVQQETADANFTISLLSGIKPYTKDNTICLYNTVVMITNRLFYTEQDLVKDMPQIVDYGCISFTIIAVGNPAITEELMWSQYKSLTVNQYVVPNYNCLPNLVECILPCGPRNKKECQDDQGFSNCTAPTTPTTTTRETTTPHTTTESTQFDEYWHIIYLFALSNRTTSDQFQKVISYVQQPLQDCINNKFKIVVRFLAKNNSDSGWLTEIDQIHSHLEGLKAEEVLLDSSSAVDVYDNTTLLLVQWALSLPVREDKGIDGPRLTLLTDFVSQNFLDAYNNDSSLVRELDAFDVEIYCFDAEAAEQYRNKTHIHHIHEDPGFSDASDVLVPVCPVDKDPAKKKNSIPTLMIIIVGTCTGAMALLIIATILYRQKYIWMEKLNRFKSDQPKDSEENDIIDYFELSWDKLIVKNERLGQGAYGQVYKGKMIGCSPAVARFHRSEITNFSDCDVAVKMLPKYANEEAKQEFNHEIQLMKTLEWHEHIVNMLGCITSGKVCLVLEYCANRDLRRYLKQKKIELEISKSVDDQVDCVKEFLNFAWQVAQGMSFLGTKNIVHRDLAARNILISGLDGLKSAKIGDFGLAMSTSPSQNALSSSGRLPIKWLALESLQKEQFSTMSDVWSFGIVLFEMYSMGEIPFAEVEPCDLIAHLEGGERPKRPLLATDKVADVMLRCWDKDPDKRPTFEDLLSTFTVLLEQATEGYGYLALIKSNDNYKVLTEVTPHHMNDYYTDAPGTSTEATPELDASHLRIDANPVHRRGRRSALTITVEGIDSIDEDSEGEAVEEGSDVEGRGGGESSGGEGRTHDEETGTLPKAADNGSESLPATASPAARWAHKVRRRKSQLAALNPFRKQKQARSSSDPRRGSDPY